MQELTTKGQSITLIYVDGTRGWKNVQDSTSDVSGLLNIATGGTILTVEILKHIYLQVMEHLQFQSLYTSK